MKKIETFFAHHLHKNIMLSRNFLGHVRRSVSYDAKNNILYATRPGAWVNPVKVLEHPSNIMPTNSQGVFFAVYETNPKTGNLIGHRIENGIALPAIYVTDESVAKSVVVNNWRSLFFGFAFGALFYGREDGFYPSVQEGRPVLLSNRRVDEEGNYRPRTAEEEIRDRVVSGLLFGGFNLAFSYVIQKLTWRTILSSAVTPKGRDIIKAIK